MEIITNSNGIVFKNDTGSLTKGFGSVDYNFAGDDTIIFVNSGNRQTIMSSKLSDFKLNGETITVDNYDIKLKAAFYGSSTGASVDAYTKDEIDVLLADKLNLLNYSTDEQNTGSTWINGKKIYCKTILLGAPQSATVSIPHNIANIDKIISIKGLFCMSSAGAILSINTNVLGATIATLANRSNVMISSTGAGGYDDNYVTLYYTCTDR